MLRILLRKPPRKKFLHSDETFLPLLVSLIPSHWIFSDAALSQQFHSGGSMSRVLVVVLLTAMTVLGTEAPPASVPADRGPSVTFNKDVLPVLQKNCQTCHRPGGIAPMSFMSYATTRPWAKAIKAAVVQKQMPPWFADSHYAQLRNAPKLTQADIETLVTWADSGSAEGDAKDQPPDIHWADGWRIHPDVVVSMQQPYAVHAKGIGEIQHFMVPNPFKEDTWVSAIEIRPGDPSVVHHVIVQIPEAIVGGGNVAAFPAKVAKANQQGATVKPAVLRNAPPDFIPAPGAGGSYSDVFARFEEQRTGKGSFTTMEAVYAPGTSPLDFRYTDSAKLIPAGKPIRIEVHYTPNGKETTDLTKIGFTIAKAPAHRRFVLMAPEHLVDSRKPIPAGESNYETKGELTFEQDAELAWFMPHMHLRGKDMTFRLIYPDGHEQTVLSTKFNFNWQLGYELAKPIKVTKGTKMIVTAHHDNSANNPSNPAPDKPAMWGEMTSQEMMLPWFGVIVDNDAQPKMIASYRPGDLEPFPKPSITVFADKE
jgi:hypothetical protein